LLTLRELHASAPDDVELVIVPDADHVDLYDRKDLIPFDRLDAFSTSNLTNPTPPNAQL